jgi:hypothetical protein
MLMPFENVHGNGGLLTTVEDLLTFTQNLETGELGGPRFIEEMHTQGVLDSGEVIAYASGLQLRDYKGVPIVEHSGSTAGYRGHLTRYPDQGLAVAVMCNTTTGNAGGLLRQVADLYLGDAVSDPDTPQPPRAVAMSPQQIAAFEGGYKITDGTRLGTLFTVTARDDRLLAAGTELFPVGEARFQSARGTVLQFEEVPASGGRSGAILNPGTEDIRMEPVPDYDPAESELAEFLGTYRSDEAEATYTVELQNETFVLKDRWDRGRLLQPLYPDAFSSGGNTFIFRRDSAGEVVGMSLSQGRVWDLRFRKIG